MRKRAPRSNDPSLRSLGPAQERPDPGLELLFSWLERQPRRTPAQQVELARAYQQARLDLWAALLRTSPDARALAEEEAEREGAPLPEPPLRDAALADYARRRDVAFAWSRDLRQEAPAAFARAEAARKLLCESNLRLVVAVAKRYRAPRDPLTTLAATLPFADLIQEGTAGLLRACDLYDPELGWAFSTYACWWIRHGINRGMVAGARLVKIPPHVADLIGRCSRAEGAFLSREGRLPSDDELAAALIVSARRAALVRGASSASRPLPLDPDPDGDADGTAGADQGRGPSAAVAAEVELALLRDVDPEAGRDREAEAAAATADALDALAPQAAPTLDLPAPERPGRPMPARLASPGGVGARPEDRARMRAAVELRWGLRGQPPLSYDDVAARLGVAREQARRLCAAGERFVRDWVRAGEG